MSIGYEHNNYGNLGFPDGAKPDDWEGWSGQTYKSGDGNNNYIFTDPVYGLRALITVINNKIKKGLTNIEDLYLSYRGLPFNNNNVKDTYQNANIIKSQFPNGASFGVEDDILTQSDSDLLNLAKGIVKTEIPEYNKITADQWQQAINYFNSGDFTPSSSSDGSSKTGLYIVLGLAALGAAFWFLSDDKK